MQRIALILEKNLTAGQTANISGILMGQAAVLMPDLYDRTPVCDRDGQNHAAIKYSTVVLASGSGQLHTLCKNVRDNHPGVTCITFTQVGQGLHNRYEEYATLIADSTLEVSKPVGVIIAGADEEIRLITKKFSLFK